MKYMENIWRHITSKIFVPREPMPDLLTMVEKCRHAWHNAIFEFNNCDKELVDYMVFRLNAAERQYMALLSQARREDLKAWPDLKVGPVALESRQDG